MMTHEFDDACSHMLQVVQLNLMTKHKMAWENQPMARRVSVSVSPCICNCIPSVCAFAFVKFINYLIMLFHSAGAADASHDNEEQADAQQANDAGKYLHFQISFIIAIEF